jgi:LPPG:FO 2-phospho-L-lactate transferase
MLAMEAFREALESTPVVAVSPFVEDRVFSGPAGELLAATGYEPSTAGVAEAYPFADAFLLDEADGTDLDRPVVRTDIELGSPEDGERVCRAVVEGLESIGAEVP